jgi:uncharacterized protein
MLSSLTTMIGFGSLMVARYTGVFSLGVLATLAIGFSLVATLVVLPLVVSLSPVASEAAPSRDDLVG